LLPAAVREKLDRLADADRELFGMLSQALEAIRVQLDDVGAQVSRVGGYVASMPRVGRLDTVR
jgi:hypothetical protein